MKLTASTLWIIALFAFTASTNALQRHSSYKKKKHVYNQALLNELNDMVTDDQRLRSSHQSSPDSVTLDDYKSGYQDGYYFGYTEALNTDRMKQIIAHHNWPGTSLVGAQGENDAWLLVQHADNDLAFQERCLVLIEKAVQKGESTPLEYAMLKDRVLVAENKMQVYGTQFYTIKNGIVTFKPITDLPHVDQRRRQVGLIPLKVYGQQLVQIYGRNYSINHTSK